MKRKTLKILGATLGIVTILGGMIGADIYFTGKTVGNMKENTPIESLSFNQKTVANILGYELKTEQQLKDEYLILTEEQETLLEIRDIYGGLSDIKKENKQSDSITYKGKSVADYCEDSLDKLNDIEEKDLLKDRKAKKYLDLVVCLFESSLKVSNIARDIDSIYGANINELMNMYYKANKITEDYDINEEDLNSLAEELKIGEMMESQEKRENLKTLKEIKLEQSI